MSAGWEGILHQDEIILWQGRPKAGLRLEWDTPFTAFFFVFFTGFSVFWMWLASNAGGFFWTFGLLFFAIGAYNLVGVHFWKAYVRSNTHYTLTDKRAFIATKSPFGKTLESYPIHDRTALKLQEKGRTANVYFATDELRGKKAVRVIDVGFEQIEDARHIMSLMQDIQRAEQERAQE